MQFVVFFVHDPQKPSIAAISYNTPGFEIGELTEFGVFHLDRNLRDDRWMSFVFCSLEMEFKTVQVDIVRIHGGQ